LHESASLASSLRGDSTVAGSKDQLHYLLHQKRVFDVPNAVLETVARIVGGIVMDRDSNLLAFGAILRHPDLADLHPDTIRVQAVRETGTVMRHVLGPIFLAASALLLTGSEGVDHGQPSTRFSNVFADSGGGQDRSLQAPAGRKKYGTPVLKIC
jgi:hypothetical protein